MVNVVGCAEIKARVRHGRDMSESGNQSGRAFGDVRAVVMRWRVPPDQHDRDAVWVLSQKVRRLGVERARSVIEAGDFRVCGEPSQALTCDAPLAKGTLVEVWRMPPDDPSDIIEPPAIVHEGDGLIVVNKPGDLAVHPTARYLHATVTSWLRVRSTPANPCHRLDRETSGVLVCASDTTVEKRWKRAFQDGLVEKTYLAIVDGVIDAARTIDVPLAVQGERGLVRIKMVVDDKGQHAVTDVEPVATDGTYSLVRCLPKTGRQHQIRAHLAAIGHPIVGDKLYQMGEVWFDRFTKRTLSDDERALLKTPRQCLHAASLRFDGHIFSAPVPAMFQSSMIISTSPSVTG